MNRIYLVLKNIPTKQYLLYAIIFLCCITSIIFVYNNYTVYDRPIATVIDTTVTDTDHTTDAYDNKDKITTQHIKAELKNTEYKGELIELTNEHSISGAYDHKFEIGNDLFISIDKNKASNTKLTGNITNVKRDKYILITAWIFFFTLLIVGKRQGFFASISLLINILLLSYALDLYVAADQYLLLIVAFIVILFTVLSLLLVNGFNEKTYAAIIATLIGTFLSLLIAYLALFITDENGLYYEEMQFLTRPYKLVFLAGLFIGSLGAVMDVAISISAALFEMYQKNKNISIQALKKSGMDVGKDIMGTMTNILFFAYVSGSIPMLILYMKNYSPLGFTLSMNLSLELARALAGGIGIVITIPIGLYITIFFIKRKRRKQ